MNVELVQWQIVDESNGLVMPWLVHPFLDWLKNQDLSDKNVIMFGAGLGDCWLAKRCKTLTVVERNPEWLAKASEYAAINGAVVNYILRECNDSSGMDDFYCEIPSHTKYDVIINDDAYRTELCQVGVDYFKQNGGGILICENWIQSYVWISPKAEEIMQPYESVIFEQPGHTENDGVNKWKTAAFFVK
jgi:hypothetical protein